MQMSLLLIQGDIDPVRVEAQCRAHQWLGLPPGFSVQHQHALLADGMMLLSSKADHAKPSCERLAQDLALDVNPLNPNRSWSDFGMAAFDMDSTLIDMECIDEMAAMAGCGAEVAAITEAAMRGELTDYDDSLRRRVRLLKGQDFSSMQKQIQQKLRLNPGVGRLTQTMSAQGLKLVVLSGGFHPIVDLVAKSIGADACRANQLGTEGNKIDGRLIGDIVNAKAKAAFLESFANQWGLHTRQCIAIGDGANDLAMMALAGLSASYRAKPVVSAKATLSFFASGLDAMLDHFVETRRPSLTRAIESLREPTP